MNVSTNALTAFRSLRRGWLHRSLVLTTACLVVTSALQAQYRFYRLTDLGAPSTSAYGLCESGATGINNNGDVVGTVNSYYSEYRLAKFTGGQILTYGSLARTPSSSGAGLNNPGTTVGWMDTPDGGIHSFSVSNAGVRTDLGATLIDWSELFKVNDYDEVIGRVLGPYGQLYPYYGHTSGWIVDLTTDLGSNFELTDINNAWEIVGNGPRGGVIYHRLSHAQTYLDTTVGAGNRASAINDRMEVAGTLHGQAFVYYMGNVELFGSDVYNVPDINNLGDVVFNHTSMGGYVYQRSNHVVYDLNASLDYTTGRGWQIAWVAGINDYGVVAATARRLPRTGETPHPDGYVYRAVKLSPYDLPYVYVIP